LYGIRDPKTRLIAAPAVRDRVLHHALLREIGPAFERRYIEQSFAAGHGRGPHRAVLYFLACQRQYVWRLHLDISAYFLSVSHTRLLALFAFIKRELKIPGYQRYMDDFVLFANDKAQLLDARTAIASWLLEARELRLNPKHLTVEPTCTPAVFLGYRVSRAGISPSRKLRRRFRQRLRVAATKGEEALSRTIRSYQGLLLFP
jgi:hypothetical protein